MLLTLQGGGDDGANGSRRVSVLPAAQTAPHLGSLREQGQEQREETQGCTKVGVREERERENEREKRERREG